MPTTTQHSEEHLTWTCRLLSEVVDYGSDGRIGARHEEILVYVTEAVRTAEPTPILKVEIVIDGRPRLVLLKLDGRSRWGSIKGRTALALLRSVASRIGPASSIVESTSGNLGIALAGICGEIGVPFTAVVDSRLPQGMHARICGHGGRVILADGTDTPDSSLHLLQRITMVKKILREDPHAVWTNQYENPANVTVHRCWTAYELDRQLDVGVQALFCPVSTGGSLVGIRECLAVTRPTLECVAVDVHGSTIFGGPPGQRLVTGIGAGKPSTFLEASGQPQHVMVSDTEAIATCRALADDVGIAVGGSSGATIAGCLRYLSIRPDLTHVLCVCPDLGSYYRDTLYDDEWLTERNASKALVRPTLGGRKVFFTALAPEWR